MDFTWPIVILILGLTLIANLEDIAKAWHGGVEDDDFEEEDEYQRGFDQAAGMLLVGADADHVREVMVRYETDDRFGEGVEAAIEHWKSYVTYRKE